MNKVNGNVIQKEVQDREQEQDQEQQTTNGVHIGQGLTEETIKALLENLLSEKLMGLQDTINKVREENNSINSENSILKTNAYMQEVKNLLLENDGADIRFFDFVYDEDIEKVKQNIDILNQLLLERTNMLVNERLNGGYKPQKEEGVDLGSYFNKPSYML